MEGSWDSGIWIRRPFPPSPSYLLQSERHGESQRVPLLGVQNSGKVTASQELTWRGAGQSANSGCLQAHGIHSFHHMDLGDQTQVVSLGSSCLYHLDHLAGLKTGSHVARGGLKLTMSLRMTSDSWSFCPHLVGAGMTDVCHHIWLPTVTQLDP